MSKATNNHISNPSEEEIRKAIKSSVKQAPDNLKYKIMHQIEQEEALKPLYKPAVKNENKLWRDFTAVFGTMYAVLALFIMYSYLTHGVKYLLTTDFLAPAILISFVFVVFWLTGRVEDLRKQKKRQKI